LQHPDPGRQYVIILHGNPWAISAILGQDYDGTILPNDEDGLAAILGAGITPRERLDEVAETLVPDKGSRIKTPPVSLEMLSSDHIGHLLSFDGAAKRDGSGGAACILWNLPSWEIVAATGHFLEKATVNEAEYSGLVKGMQLALNAGIQELVEAEGLQAKFKSLRLVHVKRDFNAAADYISKRVIQEQSSVEVTDLGERKLLQGLNRIHEKLMKDPSPREQSLSNAAEESATESGIDHLESVDPGADESGTDGAEEGLAVWNDGGGSVPTRRTTRD
ncbi:hypothetical protein PHMEG_00036564, partial [Phytophthora megakarya]